MSAATTPPPPRERRHALLRAGWAPTADAAPVRALSAAPSSASSSVATSSSAPWALAPSALDPAQRERLGLEAAFAALALWAQLALLPLVGARARGGATPWLAALTAGASLLVALAAPRLARARPALGVPALLGALPALLALEAALLGPRAVARFDAPARVVAALTAVALALATARWVGGLPRAVPAQRAPAPLKSPRPPAPRLYAAAQRVVGLVGFALAVVLPAWLSPGAQRGVDAAASGGASLARTRDALLSAGGLLLGVFFIVAAGGALARGRARRRGAGRALTYLLWAAGLLALLWMLRGGPLRARLR